MKYLIDNINNYNIEKLNELKQHINVTQLKKIENIVNLRYKKQKIVSEFLLIKGLKEFYNKNYNSLIFDINKNGKRFITNSNNIYFNISHSYDYCICAFSNKTIGVDIEKIRETTLNTINQFATKSEKEYILKSKKNVFERLFEIYTLKEAYFKMKGENLSNIKNIEFKIINNDIKCNDESVKLTIDKSIKNYIIAFCKNR